MVQEVSGSARRAVLYLRVSTEEQVENYSLSTQEELCRKEAERRNLEIEEVFREEGKSAKTIQGRPELIKMIEYCRRNKRTVDAVIVYRLDRISRQTADYLAIRKKLSESEIVLISATEPTGNTPTEKFVETMLAGFAQMDNDVRGERSRNGMYARFKSGLTNGSVPLGYIIRNGYATKDPNLFELIRTAWEMIATGTKSLQDVADFLNAKKAWKKRYESESELFRPQNLSRIFRNRFYMGKVVSHKYNEEVEGQHPAMITEEMFFRVQAIIEGRNKNFVPEKMARRNPNNEDFPLRRILKCGKCGYSFTGGWSKGKRKKYAYYICTKRCKGNTAIPVESVETALNDVLCAISLKPQTVELVNSYLRKTYQERSSTLQKRREEADIELKKTYELRQALIEKHLMGIYADDVYKEQNRFLNEKIAIIQMTKSDQVLEKYNLEAISTFINDKFSDLALAYKDSALKQKKTLLCSIFPFGMPFSENAISNTKIAPFYRTILGFQNDIVPIGGL